MSKQIYDENSIKTLNYREAAREALGMYIGSADSEGLHHLLTEIVANAMDEAAAGFGKKITITIDKQTNRATVKDEGRGIPYKKNKAGQYAIVEMCTNLHSGGKFEGQGNYKSALGLNGVGATVTCGLSSTFEINVWRDGEHCHFGVYDGKHGDPEIEKYNGKEQGSEVSFIPDIEVFKDIKWDINKIKEKIQLNALLNNGIRFIIKYVDGSKLLETTEYYYTNGIKDLLKLKTQDLKILTDPVYFSTTTSTDSGETCDVEFAFCYSDKATELIYSFVNGGYTPHDGTHVTGWKTAFTSSINKLARDQEVLKDKDKNLSGEIIRRGLVLVLSIKMSERPMFAEQTKLTLNSPSARGLVSKAVGQLTLDKKVAKQILDKIMIEQKAEDAAQRKREAQEKIARGGKNMNSLKDLPSESFSDASDFSDAEIFLTEGLSAAGGARETKNASQAVLALRGKILNTTTKELADAIKSEVIKNILTAFGCGVGEHFNINNLRYNRIIIFTDSDPDGQHIRILLLTLFLHHLPELITQGKVYAVESPIYKVKTAQKNVIYFYTEKEAQKYFKTHKGFHAIHIKGLGELEPDELYSTSMDPANRHLVQLTTQNIEQTLDLYERLMGKQPSLRREFIIKNKLSSITEDELYDDDNIDIE